MKTRILIAATALIAMPQISFAQDAVEEPSGPFEIDAEVGAFTDYRFRGLSLSGKDPEVTAELSISHESGLYVTAWASNVDLGGGADDVEVDLSLGFAKDVGNVSLDGGLIAYLYPGNGSLNYLELYGSIGVPVGPATVTLGAAYAPSQNNIGSTDNTYVYISGELPFKDSPISLHGTFGYEDGAFGDKKRDWLLGASYDLGKGFTATLDYVDTARAFSTAGKATAVFSITKSF